MRVLVTPATLNAALSVIRSLAGGGIEVRGADERGLPFGLHSRHCPPYLVHPSPGAADFAEGLRSTLRRAQADVLLPLSTELVQATAASRDSVREVAAVGVPPLESVLESCDKERTLDRARTLGIACPESLDLAAARRRLAGGDEAVVVKPRGNPGGAQGVRYIRDPADLESAVEQLDARYGGATLQEYVPGSVDAMRTAILLFDPASRPVAWFTMRKLRQWPIAGGTTALAVSTAERELIEGVEPLLRAWRWEGPAEVEFKVDARDGKAKLIEVNPRFPSYVGFPVACGLDLPRFACEAALGVRTGEGALPDYRVGVRFRNATPYLRSVWEELAGGSGVVPVLARVREEARGPLVTNGRDAGDPLPRLGKILRELRSAG